MRPKSSTQPRGGQTLASVEADTKDKGNAYGNYPKEKLELMTKFKTKLTKIGLDVEQAVAKFDPKKANCLT
jgi:hypothetical protein